jgi:hypothetical protein
VRTVAGFITGPVLLAFRAENFDGSFGLQLLLLLALAAMGLGLIVRSRWRRIVLWPTRVSAWLYFFWFATAQQARFAVPATATLVVLASFGLRRSRGTSRKLTLAALIIAAAISAPWRTTGYYIASWFTVAGRFSQTQFVDEGTDYDYLPLALALQDRRFEGAKLMLLFEHRGFYLPRPYVIGTPFFQERGFSPPEHFSNVESITKVLADEAITHVVMSKLLGGPDRDVGWSTRIDLLLGGVAECVRQERLQVVWESERYLVLEVR